MKVKKNVDVARNPFFPPPPPLSLTLMIGRVATYLGFLVFHEVFEIILLKWRDQISTLVGEVVG